MNSAKIASIRGLEILDSRGIPTIACTVTLDNGITGTACVPSGASTGEFEALEIRDLDPKRYLGKGVQKALRAIEGPLQAAVLGKDVLEQTLIDEILIDADSTENKNRYGANAILSISLAAANAAAAYLKIPLYKYLGGTMARFLPCPMMNVINGGAHADNGLEFQEFMIRPFAAPCFAEAVRWGSEIFHTLKKILKEKGLSTAVGDEGGFAPLIDSDIQALDLLMEAVEKAGFKPYSQIAFALDCASSEFYEEELYIEKKKKLKGLDYEEKTTDEQIEYLASLVEKYPIDSIEDGLAETDYEGWSKLTEKLGHIQLVGDDLFVTNPEFVQKGIQEKMANAVLIKPNQIGTLTETISCICVAHEAGYKTVVSHRSGETEDCFIADLSVAMSTGQIKTGSLSRSERTAKYNRLLKIEQELEGQALYMGSWLGSKNKKINQI